MRYQTLERGAHMTDEQHKAIMRELRRIAVLVGITTGLVVQSRSRFTLDRMKREDWAGFSFCLSPARRPRFVLTTELNYRQSVKVAEPLKLCGDLMFGTAFFVFLIGGNAKTVIALLVSGVILRYCGGKVARWRNA